MTDTMKLTLFPVVFVGTGRDLSLQKQPTVRLFR